jgi:hypothetical protein
VHNAAGSGQYKARVIGRADLYADPIVLPLLHVHRRYYGWKMAAYNAAVFYATMVIAAPIWMGPATHSA